MNGILAALDFSDVSNSVVQSAADLAGALRVPLYLLHVTPPDPDFVGYETGPQTVRDSVAQKFRKEHHELQSLEAELRKKGVDVHALLIQGPTAEKILNEAGRLQARTIVIGSHGHGALHKLLVGSVAEGVLRGSRCPVFVVPSRAI